MYKCEQCLQISKPGEKMNKVVTGTREKYYYNVIVLNQTTKEKEYKSYGEKNIKVLEDLRLAGFKILKDYMSRGHEIISEQKICQNCFNKLNIVQGV